ncbi:hypothetical protein QBC42DRAFT_328748 [Cladorrhinum samala]|uniref:Uncharacterized protein n=1 Tax=Cladorrhinum samala TaxID=585594 RepID=A0AAV9HSA6_9PEZI|nr:hypothetical protein QBC42DRAFT_328748 [Cladorrhinum samala]
MNQPEFSNRSQQQSLSAFQAFFQLLSTIVYFTPTTSATLANFRFLPSPPTRHTQPQHSLPTRNTPGSHTARLSFFLFFGKYPSHRYFINNVDYRVTGGPFRSCRRPRPRPGSTSPPRRVLSPRRAAPRPRQSPQPPQPRPRQHRRQAQRAADAPDAAAERREPTAPPRDPAPPPPPNHPDSSPPTSRRPEGIVDRSDEELDIAKEEG